MALLKERSQRETDDKRASHPRMDEQDDLFASIESTLANGPTEEDMRAIESSLQEQDREAPKCAAAKKEDDHERTCREAAQRRASASAQAQSFLADEDMARYERDISGLDVAHEKFAPIIPTTFGLSGVLSNVSFNEDALMPFIKDHLCYPCVCAVCNFGHVETEDYVRLRAEGRISLASVEKSRRAHTKKQTRPCAKPRKIQGDGTCFNSSILFWLFSETHNTVYKIRLFRTGQFGLPGTKPCMIRDILDMLRSSFIPLLHTILRAYKASVSFRDGDVSPPITLISLVSIMKNYKWKRELGPNMLLNLHAISARINSDARAGIGADASALPFSISYANYGASDAKLSVKFITPIEHRENKTVRVNIFPSGKINILGAHDSTVTKNICAYLIAILADDTMIVDGGDCDETEESDDDAQYSD
jgi:hypothetical protein